MVIKIFSNRTESNDKLFLEIQLIVLNNKVNLNGVVCTKEFINNIVANQEKYKHLPLFCDLDELRSRGFLSHKYNSLTDEFGTSQIGSFTSFTQMELDGVIYLIGTAKVSRRNAYIIDALEELANKEELKFSYEVVAEATVNVDGIEYITGDDENYLIGVAVVTDPAVPEARALMVAEAESQYEEKEDIKVDEKELKNPEEENQEEIVEAEVEVAAEEPVVEEDEKPEDEKELAEEENDEPQEEPVSKEEPEEELAACGDGEKKKQAEAESDEKKEQIIQLEKEVASLREELANIRKAEEEKAMEAKREELRKKVASVLNDEEIDSVRAAIDNVDENAINAVLAEKLLAEHARVEKKEPVVASVRMTDSCNPEASGLSKWISE